MELYNVQRLNRQSFPLPTTSRSQDDTSSKTRSNSENPLLIDQQPHTSDGPNGTVNGHFSEPLDHNYTYDSRAYINDSNGVATTPKCSSTSGGVKTEISSSTRTCSFRDHDDQSGEISSNNGSYLESEWVEHDEPGVYLTIRALPDGRKELRRVRFRYERKCYRSCQEFIMEIFHAFMCVRKYFICLNCIVHLFFSSQIYNQLATFNKLVY